MDELVELVVDRARPLQFTHNGRKLVARSMPLHLALKLDLSGGNTVQVESDLFAEVISCCVLDAETREPVFKKQEVIDGDSEAMIPLFVAIASSISPKDAEKN